MVFLVVMWSCDGTKGHGPPLRGVDVLAPLRLGFRAGGVVSREGARGQKVSGGGACEIATGRTN